MTAQIEEPRVDAATLALDLMPPDLSTVDLSPLDFGVHDLTDAELVVAARNLAALDAAMEAEDIAALEAAFAADDAAPADPSSCGEAGFRGFMQAYERRVRSLLRHYLRRPQDVDEGVQDAFLKMWLCWDPAQTPEHRQSLLFRVTRHTAYDRLKSRAFKEYEKTVFGADVEQETVATSGSLDQHVVREERNAEVRAALADLPPDQRDLMFARWFLGASFADIAASQGTTPRALITQQTRILKKLRLRLAQASILPFTRPLQRLRYTLSSLSDVTQTHAAIIGLVVTSLLAAQPAGVVPDAEPFDALSRPAASVTMEWQRPRLLGTTAAGIPLDRAQRTRDAEAGRTEQTPPSEDDKAEQRLPKLPLPTPDVELGPCGEGADGDKITVEVKPLGVSKCRKQNIVEVCPLVPNGTPGVTCHTQGKPSYLIPLPSFGPGIP